MWNPFVMVYKNNIHLRLMIFEGTNYAMYELPIASPRFSCRSRSA